MAVVKHRTEGLEKLQRKLKDLPRAGANRAKRKAITAGSTPVMKAIRRNAPVGPTKNLKKSIARKIKRYSGSDNVVAVIGPKKNAAPHDHMVEFGTAPRYHKSGKYVGEMPANPFMRRGWDETKAISQRALAVKLGEEIQKEAAK